MDNFGIRLRLLRRERDMSLDELALKISSTKSTLSKYERGIIDPSLQTAYKIANFFMVSIDWLSGYGDTAEVVRHIPDDYLNVINVAIEKKVSPEKLMQAIDLIC